MPQETVDLDKIIDLEFSDEMIQFLEADNGYHRKVFVKDALREACRQILELASERAKIYMSQETMASKNGIITTTCMLDKESITS